MSTSEGLASKLSNAPSISLALLCEPWASSESNALESSHVLTSLLYSIVNGTSFAGVGVSPSRSLPAMLGMLASKLTLRRRSRFLKMASSCDCGAGNSSIAGVARRAPFASV